ncbi:2192_t:CDS:2 [Funneliformis mosseae]|uniref:2192_t:CDS:1 n=1 Tax=Funneliformis mosseae TaxID=27381 RepID=A0A9N9FVX6_FUNMO|nr:2192_t:CDS:2 [Funneliformis mosseae]
MLLKDDENMSQEVRDKYMIIVRFFLVPIKFILMGVVNLILLLQTDVLQANITFGALRHQHRYLPLKANGSLDILEVIKSALHTFDKDAIEIGSSRSYKSSRHLRIDYEQLLGKVSMMQRCIESCIIQSDNQNPLAVLEFLATEPPSILKEHFEKVLDYAELLCPSEIWVVYLSREDNITKDPYWPCRKMLNRKLNVVLICQKCPYEFKNFRFLGTILVVCISDRTV